MFTTVTSTTNLTFGSAVNAQGATQSLELDLYEPADDTETRRPVFIWAHGGFFTRGDKSEIGSIANVMATRGYVAGAAVPLCADFWSVR